MHITLYHTPKIPVPPPRYGGGQRVVYWLGKALVQLGHQVTLIAHPDSHIPGAELRPLTARYAEGDRWMDLIPASTDIVHLRANPNLPPKPYVFTVGGYERTDRLLHPNTIFVSRKHAELHGSRHYVSNGLDPAEYRCAAARDDYAVFLAKARWDVKNLEGAIEVARRAGLPLQVMGSRNWPLNLHRLLPPIRGVRYHGTIGGEAKLALLARARCLVFPVRWHEPHASAVNEALASGCYVVGTPYGMLPEVVTPEVGVLDSRAEVLADAARNPDRFKPELCRQRLVEGGFTHLDMARKYLACYERVLATGRLGEADEPAPRLQPGFDPKALLPWKT